MTSEGMGGRTRILVVDGDAPLRHGTSHLLENAGYEVTEAATADDALRLAAEQRPALIVLDVMLPDLNGAEVCRRIKADPALAGCCVILLSGLKTASDDQVEALKSGADDYIARPISNRELVARVQLALRLKRAEDALRQSEQRYRLLAETATDVIWMMDLQGRFTYVSPSVERLRGYAPEEVMQQSMAEVLTPESLQIAADSLRQLVEAEAAGMPAGAPGVYPDRFELEQPCKDGSTVWTEVVASALRDDQGRLMGILGISRDISERKQAEAQRRLQGAALEAAADGIVIADRQGRIVWANPAFSRLTGYSLPEALGQNPRFLKSGQQDQQFYQTMWETILSGQVWRGELINRRKDGSLYTEAMVITPLQDSSGAITHFIAIKQDVTERKRVEAQYRLLFETMAQGVVYLDARGRIVSANAAAARILGRSPDQLLGQISFDPPRKTIHEDGSEFLGAAHPAMVSFRTGKAVSNVVMGFLYPGSEERRWISIDAIPLFRPGEDKPYQVYATFNDITARKRAEDQLRASLNEKVVLLQEIHHRVKNNLQVISSLLDMQAMRTSDPLAVQVLQDSQNRVRAMALVHEKLYRSQDLSSIDIAEYIHGVTSYLLGAYGQHARGASLNVQIDDVALNLDMAIPCGLIINELVTNALKYAFPPDEGRRPAGDKQDEIRVELRAQDDSRLALVICDNGVGLPPDLDMKSPQSLGLRLVSMLTQQLRGKLELDRNGGTTFTITFPGAGRELTQAVKP
jgi:PAS domain S-box-containing protein